MAQEVTNIPRESTLREMVEAIKDSNELQKRAMNEEIIAGLDGTAATYKKQMRKWFRLNGANTATSTELTALVDEWYDITRDNWNGWVTFYQPDTSAVSTGERGGDNVGLTCTPSTDSVANTDDYAGLPLFACVDCNFIVDAETLEPVITAIDGITDNFVRTDPGTYVGVLQMSGWHYWADNDTTYTHGYSATRNAPYQHIEPVPEAVRVDGTVRNWVVHAKYMSTTVDGKMTSCAGRIPTSMMSHNNLHTLSAANGAQYSGTTVCDDAWLKLMAYIKYASLTLDGILQGCCTNNFQYPAAVAETGVKRILITTEQAKNLKVGMGVLLGTYQTTLDRGNASMYSISGLAGAIVTAIETVEVEEAEYAAIYVDTETTFDTAANGESTAGTTYISSYHWTSGSTDGVLGNDGSPVSNTSGKYPAKLQGIEYMVGGYEVIADCILSLYADSDGLYWYEPYTTNRSANQATSITENYKASGVKCRQPESDAWGYIKKLGYAGGVWFPTETGGSSSTYTRDAFYQNANTTGTREWLARGFLGNGSAVTGLSCLAGTYALTSSAWLYLARLSASGNRGEWVA